MPYSIKQKKMLLPILGGLSIIISVILWIGVFDEIYVYKNGEIIKAVLTNVTEYNKIYYFKYNDTKFRTSGDDKYYNARKSKVGDTLSFLHLLSKPDVFVPTEKKATDFYTEIAICGGLMIGGVYFSLYRFFILPNKKDEDESRISKV